MPIYAYRCEACGFAKDVLQKVSDPLLTICLSCGEPAFKKQVTAAGFQLKGTGWYATDFRNRTGAAAPAASAAGEGGDAKSPDAGKSSKDAGTADQTGDKKSDNAAPAANGSGGAGSGSSAGVAKPGGAVPSAG